MSSLVPLPTFRTVRGRLLFWILAVAVPIYAVAMYMSYRSAAQQLELGAERDADELASRLLADLDAVIRPIEGGIRAVAAQPEEIDPPREQYELRIRSILAAWPDVYGSTTLSRPRARSRPADAPRALAGVVTADLDLNWVKAAAENAALGPIGMGWLLSLPGQESFVAPVGAIKRLVFDLSGLDYLSSAGIRCFVRARKSIEPGGGTVAILNPQPGVRKVLDIVKAIPAKGIFANVEELDEYLDAIQQQVRDQ